MENMAVEATPPSEEAMVTGRGHSGSDSTGRLVTSSVSHNSQRLSNTVGGGMEPPCDVTDRSSDG